MEHGDEAFESTVDVLETHSITPLGVKDEVNIFKKTAAKYHSSVK
jgi:hypothetical protein